MKRRSFLTTATLASAGLSTLLLSSCSDSAKNALKENDGSDFEIDFELDEETISSLQKKIENGTYSSEKLVTLYLNRIEAIDKNSANLNSVIEVNPEALEVAKAMDVELKNGKKRSPLHGIPVLIKDNIDTADKMQTTAGALALEGNFAKKDAFIVQKLRDAGAVIIGKTNLSEWANFRSTQSSSGWSSRGGQTKNPYFLDHNPCGSSAGSGTAVSANLCVVAIGTETDGSIVCPSSVNGIVGIKPTVGLVSRSGIIPISSTQDTAGPMARTVEDAAILLSAMTGVDPLDVVTKQSEEKIVADYIKFLDVNALKGKRIGIEKKPQGTNTAINTLLSDAIEILKKQGATVVEIEYLDKINATGQSEFEVLQYEFKDGVNKYLSSSNAKVKNLKEVIAFNKSNEKEAMPYFKQETLESSEEKGPLSDQKYTEALLISTVQNKSFLKSVFESNKLDAICGITMGPSCSIDTIYGDKWGSYSLTSPAAVTGFPHITVPCGQVYDLPVGFSFFGTPYQEGKLIGLGFAFEQATKKRVKPSFKKSFLE